MKIVQNQYEGIPIKVYKAFYRDRLIAISKKKDPLISYMEFHRGLEKGEYEVIKETMLDSTYYMKYESLMLLPFCGYFLPKIDIDYIDGDTRTAEKEFQDTINKMTYMLYLFHRTKGMVDIHEHGVEFLKEVLEVTKDDKSMKKLEKAHVLSHPLVIMGMREYLQTMKGYEEMRAQDRFLRSIAQDYDI